MTEPIIQFPMARITEFCKRWKVTELALFGSAATGTLGPESDIDLLVSFSPDADWSLLDHVRMRRELEAILDRTVDLVSRRALERSRNHLRRDAILSSARVIHAACRCDPDGYPQYRPESRRIHRRDGERGIPGGREDAIRRHSSGRRKRPRSAIHRAG